MKCILAIVLNLLFICVIANDGSDISIYTEDEIELGEKYLRILQANKDIQPKDIVKIIIGFTHKGTISYKLKEKENYELVGSMNDILFFQNLMPFVVNSYTITDGDLSVGLKSLKKEVQDMIDGKKIVVVMWTGHQSEKGELILDTTNTECQKILRKAKSRNNNMHLDNAFYCSKNPWCKNNIKTSKKWSDNNCSFKNYRIAPNDLLDMFKGKKLVFINGGCYSGIYKKYFKPPLKFLVHASSDSEYAYESDVESYLISELKSRLFQDTGCENDGKGALGKRDLVLSLSEWTYKISTHLYEDWILDSQKPGRKYHKYAPINLMPVHVYSRKECKDYQPINTREWLKFSNSQIVDAVKELKKVDVSDPEKFMTTYLVY